MALSTTPALPGYHGTLRSHGAVISSRRVRATVLVTAVGEIDAANATDLTSYAQHQTAGAGYLVLDLSCLDFFAVHGLSTLFAFQDYCVARNVGWALVVGPAVSRVLRLAPAGILPTTESVPAALRPATVDPAPLPHRN